MTDLINIVKECGAELNTINGHRFLYDGDIVMTPDQLHATVEKVCGPLVEALDMVTKNAMIELGDSATATLAVWRLRACLLTLSEFRKLMGQDK